MPKIEDQNNDRRAALAASFDQIAAEDTHVDAAAPAPETITDRPRDEAGRFAAAQQGEAPTVAPAPAPEAQKPSLTTWKKDYLPLHEKLAQGIALTPDEAKKLADYNIQREREYSTGISSYRTEAQQAQALNQAMSEFMPVLQQHGVAPAQWIQNMGRAHLQLVQGSPEQKLQLFARLAEDYGVPIGMIAQQQQGHTDQNTLALMAQVQQLQSELQQIASWRNSQETQVVQQQLSKFEDPEKFPHFEQVREVMAQLLESGVAQNLDDAYTKAVRLNDDAWKAEQERQALAAQQAAQQAQQAALAKAKGSSVSVRSQSPVGQVSANPTDRRAALSAAFDASVGGRV